MIAGHTFTESLAGPVCPCGMRWVHLAQVSRADIGGQGWAHVGILTEHEYDQIERERDRVYACVTGVAMGGA